MTTPRTTGAGPNLPDVEQATRWRDWDEGLAEARAQERPILCLAEPVWANASQRLALVLDRDLEARESLEERFVPVRLDPWVRPDVAARLRSAAVTLTGTAGPPLLVLLTPEGLPFIAYCTIRPEGGDDYPSLAGLLRSVADLHDERPAAIHEEAEALEARTPDEDVPHAPRSWASVGSRFDPAFGGLRERPKHPRPSLLWGLLDEAEKTPAREHLERTLTAMRRGGILDQLSGSFHRCSRDGRWVVPHFEKLVPQNAALAAVYARAGRRLGRSDDLAVARTAAAFALGGLDEDVMALGSDPPFYTWTPGQFQEALDPELIQAMGLHVNITRADVPHVLFRAMEPAEVAEQAEDTADLMASRIEVAKERLRFTRFTRPSPAAVRVDAPAWRAHTLRWLFRASRHVDLDRSRLLEHFDRLLERPSTSEAGYERPDVRGSRHWLEDQVAVAAACLEAAAATGHQGAVDEGRRLANLVLDRYTDGASGRPHDVPLAAGDAAPNRDWVDHDLPATLPTLVEVFMTLARDRGERADEYALAARRIAGADASPPSASPPSTSPSRP